MSMQPTTKRHSQLGLTMVELMVALVLSVFLAGGIIQIFVGNRVTFAFNDGLARIQENARLSLEQVAFTTRMAGHSGCLAEAGVFNNLATPDNFRDDITSSIQGHEANGTSVGDTFAAGATDPTASTTASDWTPALPAELSSATILGGTPGVIPGSDVLVVRGATGSTISLVAPFSDASQIYVPTTHNFTPGEILVVADCQKSSIFQLTAAGTVGTAANLVHSNAGTFTPGNAAATWPTTQDYGLSSEVSRLQTFAFYVGQGTNGRPSLYQMRLQPDGSFLREELAEGIDSMQIRYGVDNDSDNDIDAWLTANAVADWTAVLSIEITLLARSGDEYGTEVDTAVYNLAGTQFNPVDDRRFRQVFSTTVGLRNRLP